MASALLYIAAWSIIIHLSIYFRGAVALDTDLQFIVQPQDVVVIKKTSAWLNCSASSSRGAVNITWLKDGSVLHESKRFKITLTGSLLLKRVLANRHEGQYSCLASDDFGTLISRTALVKIAYLDAFTKEPTSVTSYEGDHVRFQCSIKGNPSPHIRWRKGSSDLLDLNKYVVLTSGVLQIFSVASSDAGNYSCIAKNIVKEALSAVAQLTVSSQGNVNQPVEILSQSGNVTTKEWAKAELECFATGNPKPTISWLKDGKPLSQDNRIQGNLVISRIQHHHSGNYTCIASTESSKKTIHIQLRVLLEPFLETLEPKYISDQPTSSVVRFTCVFNGVPTPQIQWYHNGQLMQEVDRVKFKNDGQTVVVQQSQNSDSGYFQCWGVNEAGVSEGTMTLYIWPPDPTAPDPPQIKECKVVGDTSVSLSWIQAPPKNGQGSGFYSVHYITDSVELQIVREENNCRINDLNANAEYTIYVMAYNDGGPSGHSETCTVVTGPNHKVTNDSGSTPGISKAIAAPSNVHLVALSPTSLNVTWDYMLTPNSVTNPETVQFRVKYQEYLLGILGTDNIGEAEVIVTSTCTILNNLKPYKRYQLEVRAEIGSSVGDFSDTKMFSMPEAAPSAPRNLEINERGDGWVSLSWEPPRYINGVLQSYLVSYSNDMRLPDTDWEKMWHNGTITKASVRGLKVEDSYHFKVAALTGGGIGPSTPTYTIPPTTYNPRGDRDKGIIIGVSIGVTCIIICIIIVLLRNRCCANPANHTTVSSHNHAHSNGSVPNGNGPRRGLVHRVDGSFQEMDSYLPMLSPQVPPNHDLDTKGGYETYPRMFERVHLIKGMNGFVSGRTRTVSSGYTSDRDLDQVDEGIPLTGMTTVGTQSEGNPTCVDIAHLGELEEDACSSGVPSSNLDSFSNHSLSGCGGGFCGVTPPKGSWSSSSRCGSAGGNSSNKDSGTGTECLMESSTPDGQSRGSSNTITLGEYGGRNATTDSPPLQNSPQTTTTSDRSLGDDDNALSRQRTSATPPQLPAFDSGEQCQKDNSNTTGQAMSNQMGVRRPDMEDDGHPPSGAPHHHLQVNHKKKSKQPPQPQLCTNKPAQPLPPSSQNASSATRVMKQDSSDLDCCKAQQQQETDGHATTAQPSQDSNRSTTRPQHSLPANNGGNVHHPGIPFSNQSNANTHSRPNTTATANISGSIAATRPVVQDPTKGSGGHHGNCSPSILSNRHSQGNNKQQHSNNHKMSTQCHIDNNTSQHL